MNKVLIVGATSAIAESCARLWAQRGDRLCLAGRDAARLQAIAQDLRTRGAKVETLVFDATLHEDHPALLADAAAALGGLDTVLIAHGTLTDQLRAQQDAAYALREIEINGLSVVSLLTHAAQWMERQGQGCIGVVSSVAGDRGRESNYVYGSAKALVTAFASGLRQRLSKKGIHVVTVKPGFVDTPMTAHLPKGPLWAKPGTVARQIVQAMDRGKPVLYTPRFWRLIMALIVHVPERLFMRVKL